MRSRELHDVLEKLTKVIREVEAVVGTMRVEHDPLASHIFVSRRHYQNLSDTKSGKRRAMSAQLSWQTACELGFRGNLDEWERLMGARSGSLISDVAAVRQTVVRARRGRNSTTPNIAADQVAL